MFFGEKSSSYAKNTYEHIELTSQKEKGFALGQYNTSNILNDPKRIGFLFARYKFVSKMFEGFNDVLEIGCQEGLGTVIVSKVVKNITAIDFYKPHIDSCQERLVGLYNNINFMGFDIIDAPLNNRFDGAFSLDVLEHIDPAQEPNYMANIANSLKENGVFILGTPSLESQQYASRESQEGHINCHTGYETRELCKKYYENVFMFGMNDEVLHTGFMPMAHYIFALCVSPKI